MKRDLIFIVCALLLGLMGVFYSNQYSDDILVKTKEKKFAESTSQQIQTTITSSSDINLGATITSISLDTSINMSTDVSSQIDKILSDKENLSKPELGVGATEVTEKQNDYVDWDYVYQQWRMRLVSAVSRSTKLANIKSGAYCEITVEWEDKTSTSVNISDASAVRVHKSSVIIFDQSDAELIAFDELLRTRELRTVTREIIGICARKT